MINILNIKSTRTQNLIFKYIHILILFKSNVSYEYLT